MRLAMKSKSAENMRLAQIKEIYVLQICTSTTSLKNASVMTKQVLSTATAAQEVILKAAGVELIGGRLITKLKMILRLMKSKVNSQ